MFGRLHFLSVVTKFLAAYPELAVGLMLTDRVTHFIDDQVDVALRIGALPDSSLVATRLRSVRHVTCASHDYLTTNGIPTTPGDVVHRNVISLRSVSAPGDWVFVSDGAEITVPPKARLCVSTIERSRH